MAVFGGTGPVGRIAALIAAQAGAKVSLVGYDGLQRVTATCDQFGERFGVAMTPADGSDEAGKLAVIADAEVILAAGRAGTQILSTAQLATARQLRVALDVNAVPPAGPGRRRRLRRRHADRGHRRASVSVPSRSATSSSRPSTSSWPRCATPSPAAISASPRRSRRRGGMPPPEPVLICALSGRALAQAARAAGFAPDRARRVRRPRHPCGSRGVAARAGRPAAGASTEGHSWPRRGAWHRRPSPWSGAPGSSGRRSCWPSLPRAASFWATRPTVVRAVKDPLAFAASATMLGIAHPEVRVTPPADRAGWLCKRAGGAGGGHVRRAGQRAASRTRLVLAAMDRAASPCPRSSSATARTPACSPSAGSWSTLGPGAHSGSPACWRRPCISAVARQALEQAALRLAEHYRLRGLASVDALVAGDAVTVLELNPRPGGSLDAYGSALGVNLFALHVAACRGGSLPEPDGAERAARAR